MKIPRIVGVAGTNGAGKDALGDLLRDEQGYTVVSLSDILRDELTRDGLEHTRENLSGRSQQIRQAEGDAALARRTIDKHSDKARLVMTSLRTPGEADQIQSAGGIVVWIDADQKLRYDRLVAARRGRVTDEISFEEFQQQEASEMTPTAQGGGLNMAGVKAKADVTIINEFDSLADYLDYLRRFFEL